PTPLVVRPRLRRRRAGRRRNADCAGGRRTDPLAARGHRGARPGDTPAGHRVQGRDRADARRAGPRLPVSPASASVLRRLLPLFPLLVVVLGLAACGGDDGSDAAGTTTAASSDDT